MGRLNDTAGAAWIKDMNPGDVRVWSADDGKGNLGLKYTLIRTARSYMFDLCDAYNNAYREDRRGGRWHVDSNGGLRLGTPPAYDGGGE